MAISLNKVNSEVVRAHTRIDAILKSSTNLFNGNIIASTTTSYKQICNIDTLSKILIIQCFNDSYDQEWCYNTFIVPNITGIYYHLTYGDSGDRQELYVFKIDGSKLYFRQITAEYSASNNGVRQVVGIK